MAKTHVTRKYTARPDTLDFRDRMYDPTLVEVPSERSLDVYKLAEVPILNQGKQGSCTGYGLATVVHYLLRTRKTHRDDTLVSGKMLYQLALRHDEWPGVKNVGSSARGAMKGWHKHGAGSEATWETEKRLNDIVLAESPSRPLGSYFRVNHKDLVAMHCAISEVGILYATATVHEGWDNVGSDGIITLSKTILGGHAFAIVGYNSDGFWIQNSWGESWGNEGFGHISYEDWLKNGTDVWVARLAVPIEVAKNATGTASQFSSSLRINARLRNKINPYVVLIGNNGELDSTGDFGTTEKDLQDLFADGGTFETRTEGWKKKRIVLYAHGGLVSKDNIIKKLAQRRQSMLDSEIFPIFFVWQSDLLSTIGNIFTDFIRSQPSEGFLGDFLLDRKDDALEIIGRIPGKAMWDEMKENATKASDKNKGAFLLAKYLGEYVKKHKEVEIHIVGHSAGSIFHAPLVNVLEKSGVENIKTCTLWAPACTMEVFRDKYQEPIQTKYIEQFTLFTLTDKAELDDTCLGAYHKSLLYLVSNSFDERLRNPFSSNKYEVPILGMAACIEEEPQLKNLIDSGKVTWIQSPTSQYSQSTSHGGFDDDVATIKKTRDIILQK